MVSFDYENNSVRQLDRSPLYRLRFETQEYSLTKNPRHWVALKNQLLNEVNVDKNSLSYLHTCLLFQAIFISLHSSDLVSM